MRSSLLRRLVILAALLTLVLLLGKLVGAAQTQTSAAEVNGDNMTFHWEQNLFEFSGNCQLTISGPYQATMTAPRMEFKLGPKADCIEQLQAVGLTHFKVITKPDAEGRRRQIVATAQEGANYVESTQTVTLSGGAEADILTLPISASTTQAHFSGKTITADLKTSKIDVIDAHLRVITPLEGE